MPQPPYTGNPSHFLRDLLAAAEETNVLGYGEGPDTSEAVVAIARYAWRQPRAKRIICKYQCPGSTVWRAEYVQN